MTIHELRRRWPLRALREHGLPKPGTVQRTVLDQLDPRDPWQNSPRKIAKRAALREAQVGRALASLEEKGFVSRDRDCTYSFRIDAQRHHKLAGRRWDIRRSQGDRARDVLRSLGFGGAAYALRFQDDEAFRLATVLARVAHRPLP